MIHKFEIDNKLELVNHFMTPGDFKTEIKKENGFFSPSRAIASLSRAMEKQNLCFVTKLHSEVHLHSIGPPTNFSKLSSNP